MNPDKSGVLIATLDLLIDENNQVSIMKQASNIPIIALYGPIIAVYGSTEHPNQRIIRGGEYYSNVVIPITDNICRIVKATEHLLSNFGIEDGYNGVQLNGKYLKPEEVGADLEVALLAPHYGRRDSFIVEHDNPTNCIEVCIMNDLGMILYKDKPIFSPKGVSFLGLGSRSKKDIPIKRMILQPVMDYLIDLALSSEEGSEADYLRMMMPDD